MSHRKNKVAKPNSIVAYNEAIPSKNIGEEMQAESAEATDLAALKELITSKFAKVADDLKAVRSDIQRFETHLGSIEGRLEAIEKGGSQRQKNYYNASGECGRYR